MMLKKAEERAILIWTRQVEEVRRNSAQPLVQLRNVLPDEFAYTEPPASMGRVPQLCG